MGVLAEWLRPLPAPSAAEVARWDTGLKICLGIFIVNEILVFYFLVLADISRLPAWWVAYTEWLASFIPAAQGHVNWSYFFKSEMPSVYSISLTLAGVMALVMGWTHDKRTFVTGLIHFPRNRFHVRWGFIFPMYLLGWWIFVYMILLFTHRPVDELILYYGSTDMIHTRYGLMTMFVPGFYGLGYWIGFHLSGFRHIWTFATGGFDQRDSGGPDSRGEH